MFQNSKTKRNISYCLIGFLGLCCLFGLFSALKYFSNDSTGQFNTQGELLIPEALPSDDSLFLGQDVKSSLEPRSVVSKLSTAKLGHCSERCNSALSMLDEDSVLTDEAFHRLGMHVKEIAAFLENEHSQRERYAQIALTTTDDDKRSFLTEIFKHLPYLQKVDIGASFIGSENWRVRADGVTLVADDGVSNMAVADVLMDMLSIEQSTYVKGSILKYLEHSPNLKGHAKVLQQLDSAIFNETDPSVRKSVLNAKMNLSEQPYHILPDAVFAIRTKQPEFQLAGLIAIDQVLERNQEYIKQGAYIDKNSIRNDIQKLLNTRYEVNTEIGFTQLIEEAEKIYMRHFEN